jgi:RNA polymerase sigma factor (sigma-70 family)
MSSDPLELLLQKLAAGDVTAIEQVFRASEPYLRRVVRRQLPPQLQSKFDSLDVVQSAWADVLKGFREAGWRFADVEHLRAFLVKVTKNRFIDSYRRHHTAAEREQPLIESEEEGAPVTPEPRPSELAQAEDLWQHMLALCPPTHRQLLQLKRQGLPLAGIATRTGLHEGSVRRVLRNLARQLALQAGTERP